jgi:hypothetical protein
MNQSGIAHLALVLLFVVVLGVVGFAGYTVFVKSQDPATDSDKVVSKAAIEAACKETDKNICKFMASWKAQSYYTVTNKSTTDGATTESTYKTDGQKKFHISASGETPYEMIVADNATYTKAANGTWWKQTAKQEDASKYTESFDFDDSDNSTSSDSSRA